MTQPLRVENAKISKEINMLNHMRENLFKHYQMSNGEWHCSREMANVVRSVTLELKSLMIKRAKSQY